MPPSLIGKGCADLNASDVPDAAGRRRPLVGVSTYSEQASWGVWDREAALLPRTYVDSITRAGGIPVLLPPVGAGFDELASRLDALVLAGGADLEPASYGQPAGPKTTRTRPDRDSHEFGLLRSFVAADLPILGVCRGMQVLNVALGGTLDQHLPDTVEHCGHQPEPGVYGAVRIKAQSGSRVDTILGGESTVRCYHHQAVDRLGSGLEPTAWAEDGTVEAVELSTAGFVLAVQWHPEEDEADTRLFEALVRAAAAHTGIHNGFIQRFLQ
jgi:putative glutamine amidotransferase